jgi:hypothetical protein
MIQVRKYKPLEVGFPAPGIYAGLIYIILPHPDPTVLARMAPGGSSPPLLKVYLDNDMTAEDILEFIKRQVPALIKASAGVASPLFEKFYQHLHVITTRKTTYDTKYYDRVDKPTNPLDTILK